MIITQIEYVNCKYLIFINIFLNIIPEENNSKEISENKKPRKILTLSTQWKFTGIYTTPVTLHVYDYNVTLICL